jgi:hypothetical protein
MRDPSDFGTRHYSNRERLQSFGPGGAVWGGVFLALVAVIGLALLIGVPAYRSFTARHTAEVVLTDKDRVCETTSEGSECKYLVYTDKTTYQVIDSFVVDSRTITSVDGVVREFDNRKSSDFYGALRECHRYRLTYYGWRSGWFSSYENLTDAVDLGPAPGCVPER